MRTTSFGFRFGFATDAKRRDIDRRQSQQSNRLHFTPSARRRFKQPRARWHREEKRRIFLASSNAGYCIQLLAHTVFFCASRILFFESFFLLLLPSILSLTRQQTSAALSRLLFRFYTPPCDENCIQIVATSSQSSYSQNFDLNFVHCANEKEEYATKNKRLTLRRACVFAVCL